MATVVSKKLSINSDNIKQYCDADNVSFDVGGHAWRKWLNGSTDGYVILKTEGKAILYPTDTAHPFKADSIISASRSAGTCKVDLQFGGTAVHEESYTSGSQTKKTKSDITDSAITNSTKSTEIKWHVYGKNGDNQRGDLLELTLYFNQYAVAANVGTSANGIQSASVSNATPYQGDSVTFTPKLVNGATWHGWYSDASCTTLVSTEQNYTVSPGSDLTLYANATIDVTTYTCSAVAKDWISSAEVSDSIVPEGGSCTFAAQANNGYTFGGWYSDSDCTVLVSTDNPYTTTITANTILYAKAHISKLNISVGTAEHGTASVSASVINYGDNAVFTFTPESDDYELYGWYSDEGLTQLVSEANPYTCTPTSDYKLWPKVGFKRYEITLTRTANLIVYTIFTLKIASVYYDKLTRDDKAYIKTGNFDKIDKSKYYEYVKSDSTVPLVKNLTVSTKVPINTTCALWVGTNEGMGLIYSNSTLNDASMVSNWQYHIFIPTQDATYYADFTKYKCDCSAVGKNGISYADATTPTRRNYEAEFTAELENGYAFKGWYSDEACTKLVSTNNPARVQTPTADDSDTSLTLYALGEKAIYTIGIGASPYGTATVSASTAQYGDSVAFKATPSSARYEFLGWYSDEACADFLSSDNPYNYSVTGNTILYPKFGVKTYNMIVHPTGYDKINFKGETYIENVDVLYTNSNQETSTDTVATWHIGELNKQADPASAGFFVDGSKFADIPVGATITEINISMKTRNSANTTLVANTSRGFYTAKREKSGDSYSYSQVGEMKYKDVNITINDDTSKTYYLTYTISNEEAGEWTAAFLKSGSFGIVWLVSANSLTQGSGTSTHFIHNIDISVSYTYPTESSSTAAVYFKANGSYTQVSKIYKKVSGSWVEQTDVASLFDGASSGSSTNYVYGGSV